MRREDRKEKEEEKEGEREEWWGVEEDSRRYGDSAYEDMLGFGGRDGLRCNEGIIGCVMVAFLQDVRF